MGKYRQTSAWSWSEKAIASLYWSETETAWRWSVTRQTAAGWERWKAGDAPSFKEAAYAMADAFHDLGRSEGSEPF